MAFDWSSYTDEEKRAYADFMKGMAGFFGPPEEVRKMLEAAEQKAESLKQNIAANPTGPFTGLLQHAVEQETSMIELWKMMLGEHEHQEEEE